MNNENMAQDTRTAVQVDIVSDVMCPWCYIGKRNFEKSLELLQDVELDVRWRPYQLDPTLPREGKDRRQYLSEKFGGDERAGEIYKRVREAGLSAGIEFDFESISVSPNTLDAHRLIRWAGGQGPDIQDRVVERLFELYFLEGANIGDRKILAQTAADAGMDRKLVHDLLESEADREAVQAEIELARQMGVNGVPCFIIDTRYAVVGAQPASAIAQAVRTVKAERDENTQYQAPAE